MIQKAKKRKQDRTARPRNTYPLGEVKQKISLGKFLIRQNALDAARKDFGWEEVDIGNAFLKLQAKHFHKSEPSIKVPGVMVDVYIACGLNEEDVYTHFYIDRKDDLLIINSFKRHRGKP